MQKGASFNLQQLKEELEKKMAAHASQYSSQPKAELHRRQQQPEQLPLPRTAVTEEEMQ